MGFPSIASILGCLTLLYIAYNVWLMTQLFKSPVCVHKHRCLHSTLAAKPDLTLVIFSSVKSHPTADDDTSHVKTIQHLQYMEPWEKDISISIPAGTRNNGSLYFQLILVPSASSSNTRFSSILSRSVGSTRIPLTQYRVTDKYISLLQDDKHLDKAQDKTISSSKPVTHLRTQVTFNIMTDPLSLPLDSMPGELFNHMRFTKDGLKYHPVIYYNFLETKLVNLKVIENDEETVTLKYAPIALGNLRFVVQLEEAMTSLRKAGFSSNDIDDVKGIFAGTNLLLLCTTIAVVSIHILFDTLAFKNDISFWRSRSTMEGLSSRTIFWRAFSQSVVFLYLWDEKASLIVALPCGLGCLIEFWKVKKVLSRKNEVKSETEVMTDAYDAESMRYLSYLLYPLTVGGAIYSLIYQPHRSWYSWVLASAVNGVYAFGFLFMLPQLFVNYRLKSVAALPWRAFMYKAFNTFIDDIFAFIITMPTSHRVACFRDDVIFLIYLYQRWLYPVDNSRVDESARAMGHKPQDNKLQDKRKTD